jgi:hypothetical protein
MFTLSNAAYLFQIFTPNLDDKNATFWIEGLFGFPGSALTVFNRWGGEVYHSEIIPETGMATISFGNLLLCSQTFGWRRF